MAFSGLLNVRREGDCLYFGMYPQTKATDLHQADVVEFKSPADTRLFVDIQGQKYAWTQVVGSKEVYRNYDYYKFEPIKWRIVKEVEGKALVYADSVLDCMPFDPKGENYVSYANSSVHKWLNGEFQKLAFTDAETDLFLPNPDKNAPYGKIFLLHNAALPKGSALKKPTEFATLRGGHMGCRYYWTATDYVGNRCHAYCVPLSGTKNVGGEHLKSLFGGVVPAVWIQIDNYAEVAEKRRIAEEQKRAKEEAKRAKEEAKRKEEEEKRSLAEAEASWRVEEKKLLEEAEADRRSKGVCLHCGEPFKTRWFVKVCSYCGKKKDY